MDMIKENELRIGNWIIINGSIDFASGIWYVKGEYKTLTFVQAKSNDLDYPIEDVKGIPLRSEILEKCGFHNNSIGHQDTAFVLKADWREQPSFHFYIEYTDSPFESTQGKLYPIAHEIKYLHQLQNLIFSLTGKELDVDL